MRIYPFNLEFTASPAGLSRALFPFIMNDRALGGIACALSSRSAGNMLYSPGTENPRREAFFASLGIAGRVFACSQTHSRKVAVIEGPDAADERRGDGLVSRNGAVCLTVTVADCLPVFLYEPESGAFGLVHSGWKGTGIVLEALRLMRERWGVCPERLAAVLGPCIGPCCYRVDPERARLFEAEFAARLSEAAALFTGAAGLPEDFPVTRFDPAEKAWYLDLPAANIRLLAAAGVRHAARCEDCTFTDERLGSFRREGSAYTRMAALVGRF
jgi:YfiH family protein